MKLKLILVLVALLGVTIGIAPWNAIRMQERQLMRASEERLRTLHGMLEKAIVNACLLTGDPRSVQEVLEAMGHHQDILRVRFFDVGGVVRYSSRPQERGVRLSGRELSRYYGRADPLIVDRGGDGAVHTLVQPVFNEAECRSCHAEQGKVLGVLQVDLSVGEMQGQLEELKKNALVATLITLGVIGIAIWLSLTALVDQPLQALVGVMGRAERGDLRARAETRRTDEIGQLAHRFNDMISKLDVAQQQIEEYHQQQLARADRLATIGEMAAAIAHEIRNPLTGISGVLSVLGRDFAAEDPRRDIIRQTQLLIERLNKTVENVLRYSRPSAPQLQIVQLDEIVDQTLALMEGEARKARVQLARQPGPPPAGAAEPPAVEADPQQLQQVLMNLMLNAVQATPAGGQIAVRTYVSDARGGQPRACVEVEDNGQGMEPGDVEKAFEPFFSTKAQGTGLGLPIAKQIVEQHGGRMFLDSTPGRGTRVRVELPARPAAASQRA